MKRFYIALLSGILLFSGCTKKEEVEPSPKEVTYISISQEDAITRMEEETGYIILDVRTIKEYEDGHIPNAICVPNETIVQDMPEELPDLNQVIFVYCRSGNRSKQASQKLAQIGYTNIYEFGGINTWTGEIVKE